jgi:Fe-S cluster assembly protein SufD
MKSSLPATFNAEVFTEFLASRHEPAWMTNMREQAFADMIEQFQTELDPEEYKRVDLRSFRPQQFQLQMDQKAPVAFNTLLQGRADFGGAVVHADGRMELSHLDQKWVDKGVVFGDLTTLLNTHEALIQPYLLQLAVQSNKDRFASWHTAFMTGGTFLYVPRNVIIDVPLYSLLGHATPGMADFSHTLVILEDGAEATLLEETSSATSEPGLHIGAVELIVGQGARLRYVQLQDWNDRVIHIAHQGGRVARDASLQWTVGGLGSRVAHIHQHVHLDGQGAEAEVNGVSFALGRQVLSFYTQQTHHAPRTHSDLLYKEVVSDRSRMIWRGMIKVDPPAQLTDGYQRNDALMLSRDARVDAIPGLEIEADDVRCTHGATAGQVDLDQVLYCMSRGMSRFEAMHMIVQGFFQEVLDRIPVEIVRDTLSQKIEYKLGIRE